MSVRSNALFDGGYIEQGVEVTDFYKGEDDETHGTHPLRQQCCQERTVLYSDELFTTKDIFLLPNPMKGNKLKSILLLLLIALCTHGNNSYHIAENGTNQGDGSLEKPFETISQLNNLILQPGDSILFHRSDSFAGCLIVNSSGTSDKPIVISSYGTGEAPVLTGGVGADNGGDYREALYIHNADNIHISDLEIQNERLVSREGVSDEIAYGIHIHNSGSRCLENFHLNNIQFCNVYAPKPILNPEEFNKLEVAGLRIATNWSGATGAAKNIRNVTVENCHFTDLQRLGIHVKHGGASSGVGNDSLNRNSDLIFRNNTFSHIGGTCILPIRTYNTLIEDNLFDHPGSDKDPRMPGRGSSVWPWKCINTVIQRNRCISIRGYLDSHGIHIDHENRNTFVQYNYMEDCEGGFVEILGGNVNAVYRFNMSLNDGWRENPNWANSNHTIWINEKVSGGSIHHCDSSFIYNNTIIVNRPYSTCININAKNSFIFNNIFYTENGGDIGSKSTVIKTNDTPFFMTNNLFWGSVKNSFVQLDASPLMEDPLFVAEIKSDSTLLLSSNSPALGAGATVNVPPVPGAGVGVFKSVPAYPETDFFGRSLAEYEKPPVGATLDRSEASLYPGVQNDKKQLSYHITSRSIQLSTPYSGTIQGAIFSARGREVISFEQSVQNGCVELPFADQIGNGIYILTVKASDYTLTIPLLLNK